MTMQLLCFTDYGCTDPSGGGGGVGVLRYFHVYVVSGYFLGLKNLNFDIFWVFRKINIFWGMMILWIFFFGSSLNWTIFRVHFYAF